MYGSAGSGTEYRGAKFETAPEGCRSFSRPRAAMTRLPSLRGPAKSKIPATCNHLSHAMGAPAELAADAKLVTTAAPVATASIAIRKALCIEAPSRMNEAYDPRFRPAASGGGRRLARRRLP